MKNKLIKFIAIIIAFSVLLSITSCDKNKDFENNNDSMNGDIGSHTHIWEDATCLYPRKCAVCGEYDGLPLVHNIVADTCTVCGTYFENGKMEYSITVKTNGGMPLQNIAVSVYKGAGDSLAILPMKTDENGVVRFTLDLAYDYTLELDGVPAGYDVKSGATIADRYSLFMKDTVISLNSSPIKSGSFNGVYKLGDVIYDFTVTDINGVSYTISELLNEKKVVMLNFWFSSCYPCRSEFPVINSAYDKYKEDVEILAINGTDSASAISEFSSRYGITVDFPLIADNSTISPHQFDSIYYPTTVIIDRYGVVCMVEIGAISYAPYWDDMLAHFTSEEYDQHLVYDYNEFIH